jgi:hypothetical protein
MIVDVVCVTVRHNFHFSTAFRVVWVSFYLSFLSFASRAHISNVEIVTLKLHYSVATQQFFFHSTLLFLSVSLSPFLEQEQISIKMRPQNNRQQTHAIVIITMNQT